MITVRTKIEKSEIHGIGLFAAEYIPKGTITWRFTKGLDQRIPVAILKTYPRHKKIELINYSGISSCGKCLILCGDNGRFINHSEGANTAFNDTEAWATRDILPGEEITENYREYGTGRKSLPTNSPLS